MSNISKFKMEADEHIAKSQSILGKYINTNPNNIAFTSSTTESLNAVLRSIIFMAGDEIVVDADIYPTTMRILEFVCGRAGARISAPARSTTSSARWRRRSRQRSGPTARQN